MKIQLITLVTPTYNNVRAASALPYHLIKGYGRQAEFEIYSYNINNIDSKGITKTEKELDVKIHLLKKTWWIKWMLKFHMGILRIFLKYPYLSYLHLSEDVVCEICDRHPDFIWIYGEELTGLSRLFKGHKCIVTMPDCESMFYYRMLKLNWNTDSVAKILKYAFAYWQYRNMEKALFTSGVVYHFVGKEDADFFRNINPKAEITFLRHPLYAYDETRKIAFHRPKIRLLFAGRYDFYCQHATDNLLHAFIKHKDELRSQYEITFLGNGWSKWNSLLGETGFSSQHINFVPDYIEELQKHDIQINAIDVGTGTKGKVLDAFANGLLVIGTQLALENIEIDSNSAIQYSTIEELIVMLRDIPQNIDKYEQMVELGRKNVLMNHNKIVVSSQLFNKY